MAKFDVECLISFDINTIGVEADSYEEAFEKLKHEIIHNDYGAFGLPYQTYFSGLRVNKFGDKDINSALEIEFEKDISDLSIKLDNIINSDDGIKNIESIKKQVNTAMEEVGCIQTKAKEIKALLNKEEKIMGETRGRKTKDAKGRKSAFITNRMCIVLTCMTIEDFIKDGKNVVSVVNQKTANKIIEESEKLSSTIHIDSDLNDNEIIVVVFDVNNLNDQTLVHIILSVESEEYEAERKRVRKQGETRGRRTKGESLNKKE